MKSFAEFIDESKMTIPNKNDVDKLIKLVKELDVDKFNKVNEYVIKVSSETYYSGEIGCSLKDDTSYDVASIFNVDVNVVSKRIIDAKNATQVQRILTHYVKYQKQGTRIELISTNKKADVFSFINSMGNYRKIWVYKN